MSLFKYIQPQTIKNTIAKSLQKTLLGGIIGSRSTSSIMSDIKKTFDCQFLSEWLPHDYYDESRELYIQEDSIGFIYQCIPLAGGSEEKGMELSELFQSILPEGAIVHVKMLASTRVGEFISRFEASRKNAGPLFKRMAKARAKKLKQGAQRSLLKSSDYVFKDYRNYFTVVFDNKLELSEEEICSFKVKIEQKLKSVGLRPHNVEPTELLKLCEESLCPRENIERAAVKHCEFTPLNTQMHFPPSDYRTEPTKIEFGFDDYEIKTFHVSEWPEDPLRLGEVKNYLGDMFDEEKTLGCGLMIDFVIEIIPQDWVSKTIHIRAQRARQRAKELSGTSDKPEAERHAWRRIQTIAESKVRAVEGMFQITTFSKKHQTPEVASRLQKMFHINDKYIKLAENYFLNGPMLVSTIPLVHNAANFEWLRKNKRTKRMWSLNAGQMLPVVAEVTGHNSQSFILGQRLGQPMSWDMFSSNTNFNTTIFADSGGGKSVIANEVLNSILSSGGQAIVVDVGQSYRKQNYVVRECEDEIDAAYIDFKGDVQLKVNAFTNAAFSSQAEIEDFVPFYTSLLCSLADSQETTLTEYHRKVLSSAVAQVVTQKGNDGELEDVIQILHRVTTKTNEQNARLAEELLLLLGPFSKINPCTETEGLYYRYFNGKANVNLSAPFVVFELDGLPNELKPAVMRIIMFLVTTRMFLGNRNQKIALVIDEAHELLKGKEGLLIADMVVRRARKYGGALITITQSMADLYNNPATRAISQQSHWTVTLKQKAANVEIAINLENERASFNKVEGSIAAQMAEQKRKLMQSVKTVKGDFSECLIMGGDGEMAIGRLILDPFSLAMYSTQSEDFTYIEARLKTGEKMEDAVAALANDKYTSILDAEKLIESLDKRMAKMVA